jgi:cell division protein FtsQ
MDLRKNKHHRPSYYFAQAGKLLLLGMVVIYSVFLLNRIELANLFPITTVRVYGIHHVGRSEVERILTPLVRHGFFNAKIDYIRDQLLQMPWVSDINVQRHWPDHIDITLIEKNAVASWNQENLLSESGELFTPQRDTYPKMLPQLVGPTGQHVMMLQYFKDIDRLLSPLHAKIYHLELTPYLTWKLELDNGIVLQMGHKDILTRLAHFVKVYPQIVGGHARDVEYVDLRYSNGMAVRWKAPLKT